MPAPRNLPRREDGVDGLLALADALGDERVFRLIRRCRTWQGPGKDPAGDTLTILARRMVTAEMTRADASWTVARARVAEQLGYHAAFAATRPKRSSGFPAFNRIADREPGDGDEELLELAGVYGDAAVYELILACRTFRDHRDPGGHRQGVVEDPGREALTILGRRMVDAAGGGQTAFYTVGERLGYTPPKAGNTIANFSKILKGGRPPENRTRRSTRSSQKETK